MAPVLVLVLANFIRAVLQGRKESQGLQNKEAQVSTRCKGSSTCFEMRKMAALRGKTTGLAADWHLDSWLSLRHMAFSGSCLGFIRSDPVWVL